MEAVAMRKTRKERAEKSMESIGSKDIQRTMRKQAADTHHAIIGSFYPDTSETEKSCKEATLKTIKKYELLP